MNAHITSFMPCKTFGCRYSELHTNVEPWRMTQVADK